MHVSEWGPRAWAVLHTFAAAWKDNPTAADRRAMYAFLTSFGPALPCPKCGAHFQECVRRDVSSPESPVLASRQTLSQWLVDVHNEVNRRLGKPEYHGDGIVWLWVSLGVAVVAAVCVGVYLRRSQTDRPR